VVWSRKIDKVRCMFSKRSFQIYSVSVHQKNISLVNA